MRNRRGREGSRRDRQARHRDCQADIGPGQVRDPEKRNAATESVLYSGEDSEEERRLHKHTNERAGAARSNPLTPHEYRSLLPVAYGLAGVTFPKLLKLRPQQSEPSLLRVGIARESKGEREKSEPHQERDEQYAGAEAAIAQLSCDEDAGPNEVNVAIPHERPRQSYRSRDPWTSCRSSIVQSADVAATPSLTQASIRYLARCCHLLFGILTRRGAVESRRGLPKVSSSNRPLVQGAVW